MEPNTLLYFYGDNGKYEGITGTSGSSTEYVLPFGWTPIEPPIVPDGQYAKFDFDLQAWYTEYIDPYDGLTQPEKDAWDAAIAKQQAIDEAQDTVDEHLAEGIDDLMFFIDKKFNLDQDGIDFITNASTLAQFKTILLDRFSMTQNEIDVLQDFRDKYEAWKALKD